MDEKVKPKVEKRLSREDKPVFDSEAKKKAILDSKMPEAQKLEYLHRLGIVEDPQEEKVPLSIYVRVRKIDKSLWAAMQAYPAAASVEWATLKRWDEIFKNF